MQWYFFAMNDPHVVALIYKITHGPSVDYSKVESLDHDETDFHVHIANEEVRFEFKEHYATEEEALATVEGYIHGWELEAVLCHGPNRFKLRFDRADIKDRNPTPGTVIVRPSPVRFTVTVSEPSVVISPRSYPSPPSRRLTLNPDVQSMYDRYMGYLQGKEHFPGMAYFCLTVLTYSKGMKRAAAMYGISRRVLTKISHLSSTKGGNQARKASGKDKELTAQDCRFLEETIKAVIRRAAEKVHAPDSDLPTISLSDLPAVLCAPHRPD